MGRVHGGMALGSGFSTPAESSRMRLLVLPKDLYTQPNFGIGDRGLWLRVPGLADARGKSASFGIGIATVIGGIL
jgi:hypothetical protein